MKYLKRFNESKQVIKTKDLQETIDEVLDSLSDKGKLSKSEKEFMTAAANDEVKTVTTPQLTGNHWADMANPHNMGTMWQGADDVWKQLEEYTKPAPKGETEDQKYEREKNTKNKKYLDDNPGLREDLQMLFDRKLEMEIVSNKINKKYKKDHNDNSNYTFNQKLDYATEGDHHSIIEQFGFYDDNDLNENGDPSFKIL